MKLKIIGYLLGVLQIVVAIWFFDWHHWNQIIVSILLFLGGIITFLADAQSNTLIKIKKFIYIIVFLFVIILFVRLVFAAQFI